ncbi:tyrosine-type recombinase/integrase [uncultured Microscilla sp.]|uniref:tyrosine-type recombinase/integrase n=1 Tax=uncultured Microscilla sp. TaxID=432653 RepID=UPI002629C062|nr:tyrosine-type recombinase/integrase [uncultured Microscilla sp.]
MNSLPLYHYQSYVAGFGAWLQTLGYSPDTCRKYPRQLQEFLHFLEETGIVCLSEVDGSVVECFFTYLSSRSSLKTGKLLSTSHLLSMQKTLRQFTRYLEALGLPGFALPRLRLCGAGAQALEVFSLSEIELLYAACGEDFFGLRDQALLALGYGCGLRRAEVSQLNVSDLHFKKGWLEVKAGKGAKSRSVPMPSKVAAYLYRYVYQARAKLPQSGTTPALLLSWRATRLSKQMVNIRLKELVRKADLLSVEDKRTSFHCLRHSIATHLHAGGMSLSNIALFLGHSSLESTRIYTHLQELRIV